MESDLNDLKKQIRKAEELNESVR